MNRMPEVYEDITLVKEQLQRSDEAIIYCTAQSAAWFVDADYKPKLTMADAVKIEKRRDDVFVVPVKWDRSVETSYGIGWKWSSRIWVSWTWENSFLSHHRIGRESWRKLRLNACIPAHFCIDSCIVICETTYLTE